MTEENEKQPGSGIGLCLTSAICIVLAAITAIDPGEKDFSAAFGGLIVAACFGLPGAWKLTRHRARQRQQRLQAHFAGYLKTHDSFTVAEMARKMAMSEFETESLIFKLIDELELELAFLGKSRRYHRRGALQEPHHQLTICPGCGGAIGAQILLAGETITCQYCDKTIVADELPGD